VLQEHRNVSPSDRRRYEEEVSIYTAARFACLYELKTMNILITGANGFLGGEFARLLKNTNHTIYATTRQELNVSDKIQVEDFFENHSIDVVLHTAFKDVRHSTDGIRENMILNIDMHKNLAAHRSRFKLMFSFCSGAAYDRREKIENIKEKEILHRHPADFYGMAKNIIARHILETDDNIINLRLFGCFGPLEESSRLIKQSLRNIDEGKSPLIYQDKKMDFFYVEDILRVVMFYAQHDVRDLPKDINLCYLNKVFLSDIAREIIKLTGYSEDVIVIKNDYAAPYTGSGLQLSDMGIELQGLNAGLEDYIRSMQHV